MNWLVDSVSRAAVGRANEPRTKPSNEQFIGRFFGRLDGLITINCTVSYVTLVFPRGRLRLMIYGESQHS